MRKFAIISLCHIYPSWVIWHLIYGTWSTLSQLLFNAVPLLIFGSLFLIWVKSKSQLCYVERQSLFTLVFMLLVITGYYELCTVSEPKWVYDHNTRYALYILGIFIFNIISCIFKHYEPK